MSLFSTKPPREKPLLDQPPSAKRIEVPISLIVVLAWLLSAAINGGFGYWLAKHDAKLQLERAAAIKQLLGDDAAKQYLKDHP